MSAVVGSFKDFFFFKDFFVEGQWALTMYVGIYSRNWKTQGWPLNMEWTVVRDFAVFV